MVNQMGTLLSHSQDAGEFATGKFRTGKTVDRRAYLRRAKDVFI